MGYFCIAFILFKLGNHNVVKLDNNELEIVPNSDGIVVAKNEFDTIQFYNIGENHE